MMIFGGDFGTTLVSWAEKEASERKRMTPERGTECRMRLARSDRAADTDIGQAQVITYSR